MSLAPLQIIDKKRHHFKHRKLFYYAPVIQQFVTVYLYV